MRIGFLINPYAGMGGRVGLKGTDGKISEAVKAGATPIAGSRMMDSVNGRSLDEAIFYSVEGDMGGRLLDELALEYDCVHEYRGESTSADTLAACNKFIEKEVELVFFAGGDGTARDIHSVVEGETPILGVPAGVKMHSGVFAVNPEAAGRLLEEYVSGDAGVMDAEVIDVDEEAYRQGTFKTNVYGVASTVASKQYVQAGKQLMQGVTDSQSKEDIAVFTREFMKPGTLYILGAGSTLEAVKQELGFTGTLLGVDAVAGEKPVCLDANEKQLLGLLEDYDDASIIVSPIGGQGFVFGRGNQQISPEVISKVGAENIIYVATPQKLDGLRYLRVDTGSPRMDELLCGYRSVIIGYRMAQKRDVVAGYEHE
mgnify:CR=1 FL=1